MTSDKFSYLWNRIKRAFFPLVFIHTKYISPVKVFFLLGSTHEKKKKLEKGAPDKKKKNHIPYLPGLPYSSPNDSWFFVRCLVEVKGTYRKCYEITMLIY